MKKIIAILMGIFLTACCSRSPNFYQTVAIDNLAPQIENVKDTISLKAITLPSLITRPQIVTLGKKDFEVNIDEFNRWATGLDKMIYATINENLSSILPNAKIERPSVLRNNYKYSVSIDILELNGRLKEKATLKASYEIRDKNNKILVKNKFNDTIKIKRKYDEYIPALNTLIGKLSYNIAKDINEL
jgi:uncharacterized lipoprotein YmbA